MAQVLQLHIRNYGSDGAGGGGHFLIECHERQRVFREDDPHAGRCLAMTAST